MTSREIIERTLNYQNPARIAHTFDQSDMVFAEAAVKTPATDWKKIDGGKWQRTDEWGNLWERLDPTSKGEVVKGVLSDVSEIDSYELPDYSKAEDYTNVKQARRQNPDKWLVGNVPGFTFNIARKMFRLDNYFMALVLERDKVRILHDKIDEQIQNMIKNYAGAGVDSIFFTEDWGTQIQLFINPQLWDEEFFPRFQKHCGFAHKLGIKVFMHSCGKIASIIPGLIKAGIDVLQFDQPDLHGIDQLAKYQEIAKITFWCPVDIQKTLQTKNEALIRKKVKEMLDKLWRGRGGFIAGYYTDNISIGLEPQWQDIASEEFLKCGINEKELA